MESKENTAALSQPWSVMALKAHLALNVSRRLIDTR